MISVFDTHGLWLWSVWYGLLWLAVVPFGCLVIYTFLKVRPATSREESTWLNGAVLASFIVLMVTSFLAALLYVRAQPDRQWWSYVLAIAVHFTCWTFLGSGVFFASLQALAAGPRVGLRRLSALLAVVGVSLFHYATLYATDTFRTRP
ncbi:MAG: hypothetical protein IT359_01675 [Gemmatimonadaceae bacterium]|nr:hypothetical protein [Gemmatimonadaceae bacterium]